MRTSRKIGRNDPCICGSGKKYKKCCLDHPQIGIRKLPIPPAEAARISALLSRRNPLEEQKRIKNYGHVKPIIHENWQGKKVVAVGNSISVGKWKTFPDFLLEHIRTVLGEHWGNAELKKPLQERHQILKWYDACCQFQHVSKEEQTSEIYSGVMDGPALAP